MAVFELRRPLAAIDWILISDELEFTSYRRLEDRLSDHLGIVADVRLRAPSIAPAPSPSPLSLS